MTHIDIHPFNLIYCLGPRSGSSILIKCIEHSCKVKYCYEPFNPDCHDANFALYYKTHRNKNEEVSGKQKSFEAAFDELFRVAKTEGWRIIKHIDTQLTNDDNEKLINRCNRVVYLYRQNIFDMLISRYLSCTQKQTTGESFWNFPDESLIYKDERHLPKQDIEKYQAYCTLPRPPLSTNVLIDDFESFKHRHNEIKKQLKFKTHIVESYEEFYRNPSERFARIVDFFGFVIYNDIWKEFTNPKHKISSLETRRLIPNYDELSTKFKDKLILQ